MKNGTEELDDLKGETERLYTEATHDADILDKVLCHVGDMGRYQKFLFLAMLPIGCTYAFVYFVQIFLTVTPQNHWCRVPELANLSMELRRNLSAPGAITGDWDHCMTFDTNWTKVLHTLTPPPDGSPLVPCQHGWEFELRDIPYSTISSEREWVCDRASYIPTAQSVFFFGAVIGSFSFGCIADRYGRVSAIIATNLIGAIGGIATIFTSGLWDFIICRFILGLSFDNCFTILFILVLEYVGPQYRTMVASLSVVFSFTLAGLTLPWIAYYIADWRLLQWVTSLPMFFVLLVPWYMPESVRWLVSRGRVKDAIKVLKRFERINKRKIPDEVMNEFIMFTKKMQSEKMQSVFSLSKSVELRKAMISLILVFMGCALVTDGVLRLSGSLGLNFFVVFSLNEVAELITTLVVCVSLDRLGRRNSASGSGILASFFLFIAIFVPEGLTKTIFAISARFFINGCFAICMQWCTEIIPTPFRGSGVSILHMSAYIADILSPFIVYSERLWHMFPVLIFTGTAFVTGAVCLTLPETKGLPMPQTRADGEKIYRLHSIHGKPEDAGEGKCKRYT